VEIVSAPLIYAMVTPFPASSAPTASRKQNCVYCGYANGLMSYVREVVACTEQYWCPVTHARKVLDPHRRYARFADFGDSEGCQAHLQRMREELAAERR